MLSSPLGQSTGAEEDEDQCYVHPVVQLPMQSPDSMHAQQYSNWKFRNTGQYEKAIGHFYDTFQTTGGVQVPSGLFHDPNIIHVPGQSSIAQAPIVQRDETKFYGGFTTADGYQVPPGLFHTADVIAVSGQTIPCAVVEKEIQDELAATTMSLHGFESEAHGASRGDERLISVQKKLISPRRTVLSPIKRLVSEADTRAPSAAPSPRAISRASTTGDSTSRQSVLFPGSVANTGRQLYAHPPITPQIVSRPSIMTGKLQAPRLGLPSQFGLPSK